MDIVFMGTPEFAVPVLYSLLDKHNVTAVITQPDKPAGRGKKLMPPPVKQAALSRSIPVYQPKRIKSPAFIEQLKTLRADIFVVAAYGQLLPQSVLYMPKFGSINVHASLLPKYRGAAPIERAIINGEKVSGVTIMQMNEGLDTGDMLLKREIPIDDDDTGADLSDKLARLGAELITDALFDIERGASAPQPQDNAQSSYASMLSKETGLIDWHKPALEIHNLIRGLNPRIGAYSYLEGHGIIKIWRSRPCSQPCNFAPGTVFCADRKAGLVVACGKDTLVIEELQAPGSKRMTAAAYMLGRGIKTGSVFGDITNPM